MIARIMTSSFVMSSPNINSCPPADRSEYVFIGRSNVGKSTLINTLCNKKELAKTSAKPGKTQLINYFAIESQDILDEGETLGENQQENQKYSRYLVDLPGYGYAKVAKQDRARRGDMIAQFITQRQTIKQVFVLVDSRIKPQALDIDFVQWLDHIGRPFSLVFTKSDKVTQKEASTNIKLFYQTLSEYISYVPPHIVTSSLKPATVRHIVAKIHERYNANLDTDK